MSLDKLPILCTGTRLKTDDDIETFKYDMFNIYHKIQNELAYTGVVDMQEHRFDGYKYKLDLPDLVQNMKVIDNYELDNIAITLWRNYND